MTDIPEPAVKEWHTAQFLSSFSGLEDHEFGLVVLNQPIELEVGIFKTLWSRGMKFQFRNLHLAKIRVCADGGANRLHQFNLDNQLSLVLDTHSFSDSSFQRLLQAISTPSTLLLDDTSKNW